jgi:hypothetical protein
MMKIQTVGNIFLDFDASKYKTKAGAAKALYKVLCSLLGPSDRTPTSRFSSTPLSKARNVATRQAGRSSGKRDHISGPSVLRYR